MSLMLTMHIAGSHHSILFRHLPHSLGWLYLWSGVIFIFKKSSDIDSDQEYLFTDKQKGNVTGARGSEYLWNQK